MTQREITKVITGFKQYTQDDVRQMDEVTLRGLLHERTHHNIEVPLYSILVKWPNKPIAGFGMQAQLVFDVWREKGYTEDDPDIKWCKMYLAAAAKVREGVKPDIGDPQPEPFSAEEMKVVHKLLWGRHSVRDWIKKEVPDWMINKVIEAGIAAPIGCNLDEVRFIVLKTEEEKSWCWSDISTENAVIIVIGYEKRPTAVVGQDLPQAVPQNRGFDCAAAGDHMLLMAHALGLGGCWLSHRGGTDTKFKEKWGLNDENIDISLHIAIGWSAIVPVKSSRAPFDYYMIRKGDKRYNTGG
ncbi:MAG: nitroreductase family protein [Chloroflexi bacterium]|nr:nitroreductase family protein [Chloroflexota bacterium]MBI2979519.1 nitroreductase family protein [Chloroflexota bacterium]